MTSKLGRVLRFLPEAGLGAFLAACALFTAWGISGFGQTGGGTVTGGTGAASTTVLTAPVGECKPRTTFAQGISACLSQTRTVASTGVEYCCCEPDGTLSDFDADGQRSATETTDLDNDGNVGSPLDPQEDNAGERFTYEWYPCQGPGSSGYLYYKSSAALGNQIYGRNVIPGTFSNSADVTRNLTGGVQLGTGGTDGRLTLYSEEGGTDHSAGLLPAQTAVMAANWLFALPATCPGTASPGYFLRGYDTDAGGAGTTCQWEFVSPAYAAADICSTAPGQIMYDSDGTCKGDSDLTFDGTSTLSASRIRATQRVTSAAVYLTTDDGSSIYLDAAEDGTVDGRLTFTNMTGGKVVKLPNASGTLPYMTDDDADGTAEQLTVPAITLSADSLTFEDGDTTSLPALIEVPTTVPFTSVFGINAENALFSSYDCDGDGTTTDEFDHVVKFAFNERNGSRVNTNQYMFKDQWEWTYCNTATTDLDSDGTLEHDYVVENNWDLYSKDADGTARSRRYFAFYAYPGWNTVTSANRTASWAFHNTGLSDYTLNIAPTGYIGLSSSAPVLPLTIGGVDLNADGTIDSNGGIYFNGNTTWPGAGALLFEGSQDGWETTFTATNPTADHTIYLPNAPGTVVTSGYGEIYISGNASAETQGNSGVFNTTMVLTSDGLTENCTLDADTDADGTNEPSIVATYAGIYRVSFVMSFSATAAETFEAQVYKNGTSALTNIHAESKKATGATDIAEMSGAGLVSLAAGDKIELKTACTTGNAKSITLRDGNLHMVRIK